MNFYRSAVFAVLSTFAIVANSASVTLLGDDVSFTFDDQTLFGGVVGTSDAIVVGNSIFFQPTDFRAESTNGSPAAVGTSDTLNITVEVISTGYVMTEFTMLEFGDYFLSAGDTSVTASGRLQVTSQTDFDCPPTNFICIDSAVLNATGLDTVGATTDWSADATVNLADTTNWGEDTLVTAQIQNNLTATTLANGETAWVQKKLGGVGLEVSVVPVPAAVWLFGSALGMLGWMRRRTSADRV